MFRSLRVTCGVTSSPSGRGAEYSGFLVRRSYHTSGSFCSLRCDFMEPIVWRTEFSEKRRLCHYGIDLFQRSGDVWLRSQAEHLEYAYTPEELTQWLREAGFSPIQIYGDRTLRAPKDDALRIWFAAKKE